MASELAEAISEAIDSTSNHAELVDRVIAENGEVSCIYCGKLSFKGLTLENGRWSSVASKVMADHILSCPNRPEAKLTERIRTLESACEAALARLEENKSWWSDLQRRFKDDVFWRATHEARAAACERSVKQLEGAIKQ